MKRMIKMSLAAAMLMGVASVTASAADVNVEGVDLVQNLKVKGEIRPRYENVDQDNTRSNANALTNRLSIGVSGDLLGTDWLSAYVEMTNISSLNDNYWDNIDDNGHSKVVDAEQTRLTQAYVDVKLDKTLMRIGRQAINLDNQRFIGSVNWRQMPQTFDSYLLTNNSIENLNLAAVYVTQVNTINASPIDNSDTRTLLLNGSYKVSDALKATAYAYMIGSTHDTYGLSLTGDIAVSDGLKVNYRAEYAVQTDASMENSGATKPDADADYINLSLGMNMDGILAGINYEVQSGDGDGAGKDTTFKTPLGTNHAFNGWADLFLSTPTAGLEDLNVMVGYKAKGFGVAKIVYHDFKSDVGNSDYGTELDILYKNKIPGVKNLTGLVKYADYNADSHGVDTQKIWLMLDYKFTSK